MKRFGALFLALVVSAPLFGFALGQARPGSTADVTVVERGPGRPTLVEVRTNPELTKNGEMMLYIRGRDVGHDRGYIKRLEPPVEPGLYRFEVTLPHAGTWGVNPRYGVGLDLYYASFSGHFDPAGEDTFTFRTRFRGELGAGTPAYLQPLGFGILGVVLFVAFGLVVAVLRSLGRQGESATTHLV